MKVKIKRVRGGSMGDQRQYGLVTGSIWNYEDTMPSNNLSSTIKESPRDEANIEAERGETIVGDLDGDGNLEHAKIGGKRHYQGGTPLNVPDGSFIFSDTSKMKIANKDILSDIFGINSKKPVTPATIAKKYELNKYKQMLEDPDADPMTKKTAQMMIDNNLKKLGQLALIQEGMKGFPDGIPDIAMPLMGSDMGQQGGQSQGEMGMARYGGLPKAQRGKASSWSDNDGKYTAEQLQRAQAIAKAAEAAKKAKPKTTQKVVNVVKLADPRIKPVTTTPDVSDPIYTQVKAANDLYNAAIASNDPDLMSRTANTLDGENFNIPGITTGVGAIGTGLKTIANIFTGFDSPGVDHTNPNPWGWTWQEKINDMRDQLRHRSDDLQKAQQNAERKRIAEKFADAANAKYNQIKTQAYSIMNDNRASAEQKAAAANIYNKVTNNITYYNPFSPGVTVSPYNNLQKQNRDVYATDAYIKSTGKKDSKGNWIFDLSGLNKAYNSYDLDIDLKNLNDINVQLGIAQPTKSTIVSGVPATTADTTEQGKRLENIEIGSENNSGKGDTIVVDPNAPAKDKQHKQDKNKDNTSSKNDNNTQQQLDSLLNIYNSGTHKNGGQYKEGGELKTFDGGGPFAQLIPDTFIKDTDTYEVIKPNRFFDKTFGTQGFDSNNNYYTITNSKTGKKEALDLDDFINRQSDVLKNYGTNGVDDWKKDALSKDKDTREKAVEWFQNKYNEWRKANGLSEYFITKSGPNPYGIDKKLGIYTWSAPGIKKKEAPESKSQDTPVTDNKTTKTHPGDLPSVVYETGYEQSPWSRQDLANYYGSVMNAANIDKGPIPILQQLYSPLVDATFLDPARTINALQGNLNTTQSAIRGSQDGPSAIANLIAASASAAPNIANVIADYENKNVGIANQVEQLNNQIIRSDLSNNARALKGYYDEMTTRDQQYKNAVMDAANKVLKGYMQGETNRDIATSANVQNENYKWDPYTGKYYFKKGYDPKTGAPISEEMSPGELFKYYTETYQLTPDQAIELITGTRSKSKTPASNENKSKFGGYTDNPMDVIWNY